MRRRSPGRSSGRSAPAAVPRATTRDWREGGRAGAAAALLALAACAPAPRAPAPAAGLPVRVVSYNIHAGTDDRGAPSIPRIGALLDSLRPDVVLLQEVDRGTARSGRVDQLAELERLTGLHGAFAASLESFQGGRYGIALLSRWPIREAHTVPLTVEPAQERSGSAREPRVALHAVLATPAGDVHVLGTHLDAAGVGTWRRQELVGLMAHAARDVPGAAPLLLGGDLNSDAGSDEAAALRLALRDGWLACAGAGDGGTFPAGAPKKRIDYVFFRGVACRDARVPASTASDHRPLVVDLDIGRGER